jgi:hypothetical protein
MNMNFTLIATTYLVKLLVLKSQQETLMDRLVK